MSLARMALWFGLVAGLGEVVSAGVRKLGFGRLLFLSQDIVWMAPLAEVGIFLVIACVLGLVTWPLEPRLRYSLVAAALGGLATAAILLMWPALHPLAIVILALGVAVQVGRLASRQPERLERMMRRSLPVLLALAVLLPAAVLGLRVLRERKALAGAPAAAGKPNVLLIIWDTVRRDQASAYGYPRPTTPRLAEWAARGARFEHAIAPAPWTLPSHATMFTGRWPHEHGADWLVPFDDRHPVIAEALTQAGYRTGGFIGNMFYCSREHGLGRGFSRYVDYRVTPGEVLYSAALGRLVTNQPWSRRLTGYYQEMGYSSAEDVNRAFLGWLDDTGEPSPGRPFFAFLNYIDAHVPRLVPAPFDTLFGDPAHRPLHRIRYNLHHANMEGWVRFKPDLMRTEIDAYDGGVAYLDHQTDALLRELERRGLLDNTIVIITSDHGELFGEHGVAGHGTSVYREAVEVPLVMVGPGRIPAGRVVERPVTLRDMAATLTDLTGTRPAVPFPGRSLLRHLTGEPAAPGDTLLIELGPQADMSERFPKVGKGMVSVVLDSLYYIRNGDGTEELYRYPSDTAQAHDLAGDSTHAAVLLRTRAFVDSVIHGR